MRFDSRRLLKLGAWLLLAAGTPATALVLGDIVEDSQLFPPITGGGSLAGGERFGAAIATLGDLDGDGKTDLLVGSPGRDDGGTDRGAVWVVNVDAFDVAALGTRLSSGNGGGFTGTLANSAEFGAAVASLGDLDGDGFREIAVGAPGSSEIWFVDTNASTGAATRQNNYTQLVGTRFGAAIAALGDLDPAHAPIETAIAVGAPLDDAGGTDAGAVYILFLDATTNPAVMAVSHFTKIRGGIDVPATASALFGSSVAKLGDLNGDGVTDLAVGAPGTSSNTGSVRILLMNANGTVASSFDLAAAALAPSAGDDFGWSLAWLGDPVSVGGGVLAVGARRSDTGMSTGNDPGAVWLVTIDYDLVVSGAAVIGKATNWDATLSTAITNGVHFGSALASLGNWPGRNAVGGTLEAPLLAVGMPDTSTGGFYAIDLAPCPVASESPVAYHSPADDGKQSCVTVRQKPGVPPVLHLYLQTGTQVTPSPANRCAEGLGTGNELCAWDLRFALNGFVAQSFAPDPAIAAKVDTSFLPSSSELRINWIDPANPSSPAAGPIRIGNVSLTNTSTTGTVKVTSDSGAVGADLGLHGISARTLFAPEPGRFAQLAAGIALLVLLARRRRA